MLPTIVGFCLVTVMMLLAADVVVTAGDLLTLLCTTVMLISGTLETCTEGTDAPGAFVALPAGLFTATRLTVIDGDAVANRFRALLLALFAPACAVRLRAVLLAGLMTVFGSPEAAEIEPVPPVDAFPMGICTGDAFLVSCWLAFTTNF